MNGKAKRRDGGTRPEEEEAMGEKPEKKGPCELQGLSGGSRWLEGGNRKGEIGGEKKIRNLRKSKIKKKNIRGRRMFTQEIQRGLPTNSGSKS